VGIIWTAWPWRESSPNELEDLIFKAPRVESNFLGEVALQLRCEGLKPTVQLLYPMRIGR
jgi:hypothetical protein